MRETECEYLALLRSYIHARSAPTPMDNRNFKDDFYKVHFFHLKPGFSETRPNTILRGVTLQVVSLKLRSVHLSYD